MSRVTMSRINYRSRSISNHTKSKSQCLIKRLDLILVAKSEITRHNTLKLTGVSNSVTIMVINKIPLGRSDILKCNIRITNTL